MASAPKHLLLYQLRDELMEVLCASAGRHYQGMAAAARSSTLPRHVKNKIAKLDFAYNLVRHITAESANAYVADITTMLGAPVKHEEVKDKDKERDALYDNVPWAAPEVLKEHVGDRFEGKEQEASDTIDVAKTQTHEGVDGAKHESEESIPDVEARDAIDAEKARGECDPENTATQNASVQRNIDFLEGNFSHGAAGRSSATRTRRKTEHAEVAAAEAATVSAMAAAAYSRLQGGGHDEWQ